MNDTTTTATVITPTSSTQQSQTLSHVVGDAIKLEQEGKALYEAHKAGGWPATISLAASLRPELEQDIEDVEAVIPIVKSGYQTTEFWLVIGYAIVNVLCAKYNIIIPQTDDVTIGALVAAYISGRALIKNKAVSSSSSPSNTVVNTTKVTSETK